MSIGNGIHRLAKIRYTGFNVMTAISKGGIIVFFSSAFAGDFLSLDQRESQAFPHGGAVGVDGGADGGNVVGVQDGICQGVF